MHAVSTRMSTTEQANSRADPRGCAHAHCVLPARARCAWCGAEPCGAGTEAGAGRGGAHGQWALCGVELCGVGPKPGREEGRGNRTVSGPGSTGKTLPAASRRRWHGCGLRRAPQLLCPAKWRLPARPPPGSEVATSVTEISSPKVSSTEVPKMMLASSETI